MSSFRIINKKLLFKFLSYLLFLWLCMVTRFSHCVYYLFIMFFFRTKVITCFSNVSNFAFSWAIWPGIRHYVVFSFFSGLHLVYSQSFMLRKKILPGQLIQIFKLPSYVAQVLVDKWLMREITSFEMNQLRSLLLVTNPNALFIPLMLA